MNGHCFVVGKNHVQVSKRISVRKMNESQAGFYTDLCCSTKLDQEVLDELISELILTFEDREDILHQSTQRERNETLLDILSSRPYDTTCYLADALNNCNHKLSNMVKLSAKKEVFIKGKDTDASSEISNFQINSAMQYFVIFKSLIV